MAENPSYGSGYGGGGGASWVNYAGAAGGGAGTAGFFSGVHSLAYPAERKYRKKMRKYEKAVARARHEGAMRQKDQYVDDSNYREALLQQSHYGRGLGNSSIATEDNERFRRAKERAIANLDTEISLTQQGYDLVKRRQKNQQINQYIQLFDQLVGIAGGAVAAAY